MRTEHTLKSGDHPLSTRLHCLADDLWVTEQPQADFGLCIGTRMTVIRQRGTNKLVPLSPIQPSAEREQGLAPSGRASVGKAMQVVLPWTLDRVIVVHGAIVETGSQEDLRKTYTSFLGGGLKPSAGNQRITKALQP